MRRLCGVLLVFVLALCLAACTGGEARPESAQPLPQPEPTVPVLPPQPAPEPEPEPLAPPTLPGRIAIITDNWHDSEEYLSATSLVEEHGAENIVHLIWPGWRESEIITLAEYIAKDSEIRVVIVNHSRSGIHILASTLRELRDDIFIIYAQFAPHPDSDAFDYAGLIITADMQEVWRQTPAQARALGADTLVLFAPDPELLGFREGELEGRLLWRARAEEAGLNFVEALYGDLGDSPGISEFIGYVLPGLVEEHGNDLVFVGLSSERLLWHPLGMGAIYVAPQAHPAPSPYFLAGHFRYLASDWLREVGRAEFIAKENLARIIEETRSVLEEVGLLGRVSTWPVSTRSMFTYAAVEYAIMWMSGELPEEGVGSEALRQIMVDFIARYAAEPEWGVALTPLEYEGTVYPHYLLVFLDFMTY